MTAVNLRLAVDYLVMTSSVTLVGFRKVLRVRQAAFDISLVNAVTGGRTGPE